MHRMVASFLGFKKDDKVNQPQPISELVNVLGPPVVKNGK